MGHYSLDMSLVSVLLDIEHHYNHTFVFCIKESLFVQWFIDLQTKHCSKVTTLLFCKGCQVSTLQSSLPPLPRTDWGLWVLNTHCGNQGSDQNTDRQSEARDGRHWPITGRGWSRSSIGTQPRSGGRSSRGQRLWCHNQKPQDTQRPGWATWAMIWVQRMLLRYFGHRQTISLYESTHHPENFS